jgi:hypothetical protein
VASRDTNSRTGDEFLRVVLGNRELEVKEKFISEEMMRGLHNKPMKSLVRYFGNVQKCWFWMFSIWRQCWSPKVDIYCDRGGGGGSWPHPED